MLRKNILLPIIFLATLYSCSGPKLTVIKKYPAINNFESVYVSNVNPSTKNIEEIGLVEVGDMELSWGKYGLEDCSYYEVLKLAKQKASEIGGNLIYVVEHKKPTTMGSACHRIKAKIYRTEHPENFEKTLDTEVIDENHVTLNIYRQKHSSMVLIPCVLKLNDSTICRVNNGFAETIKLDKSIQGKLKAIAGVQKFVTEVSFKVGHVYYVLCSTTNAEPFIFVSENDERLKREFESMIK